MNIRFALASSALALLAACGQTPDSSASGDAAVSSEPLDLKAPAGTYALDNTHASLIWSIPHLGLANYTARFASFDAQVTLDPENLDQSSVTLTIDANSVRTDYPGDYRAGHPNSEFGNWDEDIAFNPFFLDGRTAPQISFASTSVEQTGPRTAKVTGDLTFRGQTKPITMDATFNGELENHPMLNVPAIGFSAEGSFKPSDFGVNLLGGMLGDEVKVHFQGEFLRQQDEAGQTASTAE